MAVLPDRSLVLSYALFILLIVLVGWLQLATIIVAALFSFLALRVLCFGGYKRSAVALFLVLLAAVFYGFVLFINHAIVALPEIASTSIPIIVRYATERGIELPFSDTESLKSLALDSVRTTVGFVGNFAKIATKEFVFLVVGVCVAVGIFMKPELEHNGEPQPLNLYTLHFGRIAQFFFSLYHSFERVMGAQVIISAINTGLTAIFLYSFSLRYAPVLVAITFLCGLLPVIGNIVSNTIIVSVAFTVSPQFAGWALLFLVSIHKLEYFLNSKIIGKRIQQPMWLTLIALVLGERLFGISGVILAPVVLNFIKVEASQYEP